MSDGKKKPKKQRDGLSLRGGIWYFRRVVNGKRTWVTTRCKDRNSARRRATEIQKDQNDGVFGWKKPAPVVVPTITEYVERVRAAYGRLKSGVGALFTINRFATSCHDARLDAVTPSDCQGYLHTRRQAGASQNYVRSEHIALKAFWGRAMEDELVVKNPWRFKLQREVPRGRVLSFAEQKLLWALLPGSIQRAATVVLFTGLRNNEVCHIERDDLDVVRGLILLRAETTKTKQARIVPMPAEALTAIREQIAALDQGTLANVFPRFREGEQRIFPYSCKKSLVVGFRRAVKKAGIPGLTIHDLRRTFGTRCAEHGVPMRVLQKWLGHSSITMTERFYTNVNEQRLDHLDAMLKVSRQAMAEHVVLPITGTGG